MDNIRSVMRWKCQFNEEGQLTQLPQVSGGWDFGRTLDVVYQKGRFYVVRRKGHTAWSGVGMTSYYCTTYSLLEVNIEEKWVEFEILEQQETEDRPWREIRRDMFARAKRLHEAYKNENV